MGKRSSSSPEGLHVESVWFGIVQEEGLVRILVGNSNFLWSLGIVHRDLDKDFNSWAIEPIMALHRETFLVGLSTGPRLWEEAHVPSGPPC